MKRFYTQAGVLEHKGAFGIALDGRPVKTPMRAPLAVPTRALAEAIAGEWDEQGEEVDLRSMPLTGLANAAIDRVAPDVAAFAAALARYAETDLLCYRADYPADLVARQAQSWDPLLAWARRRYDIDFEIVGGIMHRPQHEETLQRLGQAVAARSPFELAGLSPLVTIGGSLVIALALVEGAIDLDTAWAAASLDDLYQVDKWGEDADAARVLEARRQEFAAGYRFLTLALSSPRPHP